MERVTVKMLDGRFADYEVAGRAPDAAYGARRIVIVNASGEASAAELTSSGWRIVSGPIHLFQ